MNTLWQVDNHFLGGSCTQFQESWAAKNWCFWTMVLEKTLESPLNCKEIQAVHPKGDQSWVFIGRTDAEAETPILWPPDAKNWLIRKDTDAWKDWSQGEKGTTEDEMVGCHHRLNEHDSEQTLGVWTGKWWTEKPGVPQAMGSQSRMQLSDWTELDSVPMCEKGSFHRTKKVLRHQVGVLQVSTTVTLSRDGVRFGR